MVLILSTAFGAPNPETENLANSVLFDEYEIKHIKILNSISLPSSYSFYRLLPTVRKNCIAPFISALKGCTDLDGHRNIAVLESLVDFLTENGGRRFNGKQLHSKLKKKNIFSPISVSDYFHDKSGSKCVDQYQSYIVECFNQLPEMFSKLQSNVSIFNKENCR